MTKKAINQDLVNDSGTGMGREKTRHEEILSGKKHTTPECLLANQLEDLSDAQLEHWINAEEGKRLRGVENNYMTGVSELKRRERELEAASQPEGRPASLKNQDYLLHWNGKLRKMVYDDKPKKPFDYAEYFGVDQHD